MIEVDVIARLKARLGPRGWRDGADAAPYLHEQRGRFVGQSPLVCLPDSVDAVRDIVRICHAAGVAIVPQGGNTGLVCGALADGQIILSLTRLNRIRSLDPADFSITVDAGVTIADVQQAARDAGRLFPLSLAAEGTATIGGAISTNAGGVQVLKYGPMRDLVLGIEAVLPDGTLWNGLTRLRKDNTGYALRHLFIGGEGTLGIVTGATLKLYPAPQHIATAIVAVPDPETALKLLAHLRGGTGDTVTSCELIRRFALDLVLEHVADTRDPLDAPSPWYVLVEAFCPAEGLGEALMNAGIEVAALAQTEAQRQAFWRLREAIPEAQTREGASLKHDIAVPVSAVPVFLDAATAAVSALVPGIRPCPFGHLGDGNIHFNLTQPEGADKAAYLGMADVVKMAVHDIATGLGGSISAEHGIGRLKRAELAERKSPEEIAMMRAIKRALDPDNLMNPGAILDI